MGARISRRRIEAFAWIVCATALGAPTAVSQVNWVQRVVASSPTPRYGPVLAYDSARGRTVLFGGYLTDAPPVSDTWEWDGRSWTEVVPARRPPGRYYHAMAYDSARGRTVLFGGLADFGYFSDTWEWDGVNWTQRFPATSPSPRLRHVMAYDSTRGRTLLFGGYDGYGGYLSDTWEWDGTNWVQRFPTVSPTGRISSSLAHDSARGRTVLFGGFVLPSGAVSETWEWDGTNWSMNPFLPTHPSARGRCALAYDSARGRTVLFGGEANNQRLSDTWEWDGSSWVQLQPSRSPSPRANPSMVYDSACGWMVEFGGSSVSHEALTDTWNLSPLPTVTRVVPAIGSENGGDFVQIDGSGFTGVYDSIVSFGGQGVRPSEITCTRLRVRTPPGVGVVDVTVRNSLGSGSLASAYTYVAAPLAARYGNVNEGVGDRENVLQVNGNTGDVNRELTASPNQALNVYMLPPSSRTSARFVLYVWAAVPTSTTLTVLPRRLGTMVFPTPFAGSTPRPSVIFNNIGLPHVLGTPTYASSPAPSLVLNRASGTGRPLDLTFQGIIVDDGSQIPEGYSITNAVILRVQ